MCGINGLYYFDQQRPVEGTVIDRMRRLAHHRGPDDHGVYFRDNVGLGFNRLSIIDLSGGHQPMSNEDGTVWIVFNGEIYNFGELRQELLRCGHRFQTRSDTETIVHAWEEYGERCVEKLRGMFAFAIYDERRRVLFIARDRLGIKPVYYYHDRDTFAFASEIKSLLEIPSIPRELDTAALGEFLRHRYVIAPNTMLRGIRKLEPGHTILVDDKGARSRRYWSLPLDERSTITESEALEELDSLIEEVLRLHLIADVSLGAFLSGGLDSSCVVGLMSKQGVRDIKTFSIGYDSPESELGYARLVADHFHTDHHELRLTSVDFRDTLPKIVWYMDEPVGDTASIPLFYLSRFARKNVTVVLSGEGSDEIFGGYPIYGRIMAFQKLNRIPFIGVAGSLISAVAGDTKVKKYAEMWGRPLEDCYAGVGGLFSHQQICNLYPAGDSASSHAGTLQAYSRCVGLPTLTRMAHVDTTTWLPDDLLVKADRMTMANSLELRVPFLDHHLVEFALRLPARLKVHGSVSKFILKRWAESILPTTVIHRTKKGFPVPTKAWFRGELRGFAHETLLAQDSPSSNLFSRSAIERLLRAHSLEDRSTQIYSLLVFDSWHRQFLKPHPGVRSVLGV